MLFIKFMSCHAQGMDTQNALHDVDVLLREQSRMRRFFPFVKKMCLVEINILH
jgi:hypothetical protein